jgi:hypothetical protein
MAELTVEARTRGLNPDYELLPAANDRLKQTSRDHENGNDDQRDTHRAEQGSLRLAGVLSELCFVDRCFRRGIQDGPP